MDQPLDTTQPTLTGPAAIEQDGSERLMIPVLEEQLRVSKQMVETGVVRISKTVHEEEVNVAVPVVSEETEVERVKMNQYVDAPPAIRYEGETMIIPVLREVVEKRLVLVEEVRVTRKRVHSQEMYPITLRREKVDIERIPVDSTPHPAENQQQPNPIS